MSENDSLDELDHICVVVRNLDEALAWYTSSFNCEVKEATETQALLRFKNAELLLTLPSQAQSSVAFKKSDAESFGELIADAGGKLSTTVADPTGNLVKLVK